jgi:endonuclease-3 related protein
MSESDFTKIQRMLRIIAERGSLEGWWPGGTEEVVIGAVLTQQTRWEIVELALKRLKERGICDLRSLHHAPEKSIEDAIRPAGFYRVKTRRIKALASLVIEQYGSLKEMEKFPLEPLRKALLGVHGIGRETADSILCFGLQKPTLVIDRYTERICACADIKERGEDLKILLETSLQGDATAFRRVHAQFVEHAKAYCGKKRCAVCGIATLSG